MSEAALRAAIPNHHVCKSQVRKAIEAIDEND